VENQQLFALLACAGAAYASTASNQAIEAPANIAAEYVHAASFEAPPQRPGPNVITYLEDFPDPLGGYQSRWLYLNTNTESYYYAGGDCDADNRGNQPDGIWISDDQGCGGMVVESPVRIDFVGGFGDDATYFGLDMFTCVTGVTFNIYDQDGVLAISEAIPATCWSFTSYGWTLTNGISAYEWVYTDGQVEGNTSIDNVRLDVGDEVCDLSATLTGYPATILPGETLTFTATAANDCDEDKSFDQATMVVTGPAGLTKDLYNGAVLTIAPGGSLFAPVSLNVPPVAPLGTYNVEVTIYLAGVAIDSDDFDIVVGSEPTEYLETFPDPLGGYQSRWLYLNSNTESYYYAGGDCDADYRGNQPDGIWISDDQGCGGVVVESPVRIDFAPGFGDGATYFGLDMFTCVSGVTFNVYDEDGVLAISEAIPATCWSFTSYGWTLTNGISAFEWAYTDGQVEGNTSIDNVELVID